MLRCRGPSVKVRRIRGVSPEEEKRLWWEGFAEFQKRDVLMKVRR